MRRRATLYSMTLLQDTLRCPKAISYLHRRGSDRLAAWYWRAWPPGYSP